MSGELPAARYAHVKPAPFWRKRCGRTAPGSERTCTREPGHRGPHVAHGPLRRVVAVWEAEDSRVAQPSGRKPATRRPVGLPSKGSSSLTGRLGVAAKFMDEHIEEIALAVFFVAFVWFAIEWLMIILR
ncbi:MAG: hypothetical protein HKO77_03520 [Gemmatimonadetes bacterium]|nr:hypothetical protein [Gemmatimonadota bacterium]